MKQGTFQQWASFILSAACLLALMVMFCVKGVGGDATTTAIEACIGGAFSTCVMALIKASSDAKNDTQMQKLMDNHSDQIKQMTDGLANSTPVPKNA